MKPKPTVVVIGAGSVTFTPKLLRDMLHHPALGGSTMRLVDINEESLETMRKLGERLNQLLDEPWKMEATTDRREALPGADYVIISVDVARVDTWRRDFELPVELGVRQVTGELGGPGGLFHSLRQIPLHVEMARDCARLCPQAVVMVESNPLNRICLAMRRHSDCGQILGLCHGVEIAQYHLGRVLGLECEDIETTAVGVNHFTWILDMRLKATGEDLYPALREKLEDYDPGFWPLSRKLFEVYGVFPSCGDEHIGEYLPYAWEFCGLEGPDFSGRAAGVEDAWKAYREIAEGNVPLDESAIGGGGFFEEQVGFLLAPRSWIDTLAFPIMNAACTNDAKRMPAVNMINAGAIANLPADVFVEGPALADSSGVRLLSVGEMPKPLAAFCRRDAEVCEMTVEAAVSSDRNLIIQTMLLDPVIDSVATAEKVCDAMIDANEEYLARYK